MLCKNLAQTRLNFITTMTNKILYKILMHAVLLEEVARGGSKCPKLLSCLLPQLCIFADIHEHANLVILLKHRLWCE